MLQLNFQTLEGGSLGVVVNGRNVELQVAHFGINSAEIARMAATPEVQNQVAELRKKYNGKRIILGIDELDVVRGTINKFQAYNKFLELHEEWKSEIVILQIVKPTPN